MPFEDVESEVRALTGRLDPLVPKDGAHLLIRQLPGGTTAVGNASAIFALGSSYSRSLSIPCRDRVKPRHGST